MARREPPQQRAITFLREVWAELKKVVWPSRAEVVNYSSLVIGVIIVVGGLFAVLDRIFRLLAKTLGLYQ